MTEQNRGARGKALVIGAGIGGLTAAVALRWAGYDVHVYERARKLNPAGTGLGILANAPAALRTLDLDLRLPERGKVADALHIRASDGRPIRTLSYDGIVNRLGESNVTIHRADLQQALVEQLDGCPITLNATAVSFDQSGGDRAYGVRVDFADGRQAHGDLLVGADGFNSVVRRQLTPNDSTRYSGYVGWFATTTFRHPSIPDGYSAHYWGPGQRFGIHDVGQGRIYWWGAKNMPEAAARQWSGGRAAIAKAFAGWAPEITALIDATPTEAIIGVPIEDRPPLRRWGDGPVTLLGDAAHPMLPSLSQGAGMAIEDAVALGHALASAPDLTSGLREYEAVRAARTAEVVRMSRMLSRVESLENPLARRLRDAYFRRVPSMVINRPIEAMMAKANGPAVHRRPAATRS